MYNVSNTIQLYFSLMWQCKLYVSASVVAFLPVLSQGPRLLPSCGLPSLVAKLSLACSLRKGLECGDDNATYVLRSELVTKASTSPRWLRNVVPCGAAVSQIQVYSLEGGGSGVKMGFDKEATICTWDFHAPGDWHFMRTEIMQYVKFCDKSQNDFTW